MRFVTRADVEIYLQYAKDPVIQALLGAALKVMDERGVDWLECDPALTTVISA